VTNVFDGGIRLTDASFDQSTVHFHDTAIQRILGNR